jgi:hypothetical protein
MKGLARQVTVVLGVAAMTFAASLSVLWPRETQADDEATEVAADDDFDPETTKAGKLAMKSRLVEDERVKGRWYLEMEIQNNDPLDRQAAEVEGQVMAFDLRSEMSRSAPMPRVLFKCNDEVQVAAGETVIRRHVLPAALAKKLAATQGKRGVAGNAVVRSTGRYQTSIAEVDKADHKQPAVRQASRS